jgi:hypothetical protein
MFVSIVCSTSLSLSLSLSLSSLTVVWYEDLATTVRHHWSSVGELFQTIFVHFVGDNDRSHFIGDNDRSHFIDDMNGVLWQ